jgi:hypothetical protein
VYSCKRSERKRKGNLEDPDSSLVECAALSTVKGDFLQDNIFIFFRIEQWKNNGFLFK